MIVLDAPIASEIALYRDVEEIYSNLSTLSSSKLAPFVESFPLLMAGDNFSLAQQDGKTIVVSKISEKSVLIVVTDQRIGTVLVKLREVAEKYGKEADEQQIFPAVETPEVKMAEPTIVSSTNVPPPKTVSAKTEAVSIPTQPSKLEQVPSIETFMAPMLVDKSLIRNYSGDEKKILSLCTGRFSIAEISKKTKIAATIIIEVVYAFAQNGALELRREKKTSEEQAVDYLKGL
jgi:hypothetical protein